MVTALEQMYSFVTTDEAEVCFAVFSSDADCPVEFPFEVGLNITGKGLVEVVAMTLEFLVLCRDSTWLD